MNGFPLRGNEIWFLFTELKVAINLPSVLYFVVPESG